MSILLRIFRLPEPLPTDPIDHPDLRRMTSRELADLPFPRIAWKGHSATMACDAGAGDAARERKHIVGIG